MATIYEQVRTMCFGDAETDEELSITLLVDEIDEEGKASGGRNVGSLCATHIGNGTVRLYDYELDEEFIKTPLHEYSVEAIVGALTSRWKNEDGRTYIFMRVPDSLRVPLGAAWVKHGFKVRVDPAHTGNKDSVFISGFVLSNNDDAKEKSE